MNNGTFAYMPAPADADAMNKPSPYAPQQQQYGVYPISLLYATPSTNDEESDNHYLRKCFLGMILSIGIITLIGCGTSNSVEYGDNQAAYDSGLALESFIGASLLMSMYAFYLTVAASYRDPQKTLKSDVSSRTLTHFDALTSKWYAPAIAMGGAAFASPVLGQLMTGDVSLETLSHATDVGVAMALQLVLFYLCIYAGRRVVNYFMDDSKPDLQAARL